MAGILVSGCLLGLRCRYDGQERKVPEKIRKLLEEGKSLIPVCPEQLGGLPTPRAKSHLNWKDSEPKVITDEGKDVTFEFMKGAEETLRIARLVSAKKAIFKSSSPSCGEEGVANTLLRNEGIEVEVIQAPKL